MSQNLPIWNAWSVVLVPRPDPVVICGMLKKFKPTFLPGVPKILEACAIGVPDPYRGETVKAYVVPMPQENSTEKEVIAYCRKNLAAYKAPAALFLFSFKNGFSFLH